MSSILKKIFTFFIPFICLAFLAPQKSWGYGAIYVDSNGTPFIHQNLTSTTPLTWNPDSGPLVDNVSAHDFDSTPTSFNQTEHTSFCNSYVSNTTLNGASNLEGIQIITNAWAVWANSLNDPPANVSFSKGSSLGVDVNVCNYNTYIDSRLDPISGEDDSRICACTGSCAGTCKNPIIFDANGDIVSAEFGEGNRATLLGAAGPIIINGYDHILRMEAIINGSCLQGSVDTSVCQGISLTSAELKAVMVHELGHALGLDHTQTNVCITDDADNSNAASNPCVVNMAQTGNNAYTASILSGADEEDAPTMFPLLYGEAQATLARDDMVGLARLYPKANFSTSTCTIHGQILKNGNGLACAEVVVRDVNDPTGEALSFITGSESSNHYSTSASSSGCEGNCGNYTIEGLKVGRNYSIEVNPIFSYFDEGSSINPCNPPSSTPNPGLAQTSGVVTCSSGGEIFVDSNTGCSGISNCSEVSDLSQIVGGAGNDGLSGVGASGCSLGGENVSPKAGSLLLAVVFSTLMMVRVFKSQVNS